VKRCKKPSERRELLEKNVACAISDCTKNEVGEQFAVTELLDQHEVESGIAPERTGHVMREADKADAAQMPQIPVLCLHPPRGCLSGAVCEAPEELPDDADPAVPVLIEVDMVGPMESKHPEICRYAARLQLRENIVTKIPVQRIASG